MKFLEQYGKMIFWLIVALIVIGLLFHYGAQIPFIGFLFSDAKSLAQNGVL